MTAMRWAIMILLLSPALALGQAQTQEEEEEKVSNDNPARPLQMRPASTEVKEAFDDFDRFRRRGAWERALKALYTIPEVKPFASSTARMASSSRWHASAGRF